MRWRRRSDELIAGCVGTATLIVGLARAGDQPFWFDEAFTAGAAQQSFGDLLHFLWREAGMAPYYLALWVWALFGQSEWWLRSLSVLGGAATVGVTYLFVARHVDRTVAALAVVGLWCNSFFLYNLTELRAYSWTMFAAVVTTWAFLRLRSQPTTRRAISYGVAAGLSLGMLLFSAGLLVAHLLGARRLWTSTAGRRALLIAAAVTALLFAPSVHALVTSDQIAWIPHTTWRSVDLQTAGALGGGRWRLFDLGGCTLLLAFLVRQRRRGAPRVVLETVLLAVATSVVTLLLLSFIEPVFIARYLAFVLPLSVAATMTGYVLAARAVIARVPRLSFVRVAVPIAIAGACVVGFKGTPFDDLPKPEDIRLPAQALAVGVRPGDAVVFGGDREALAIGYYFQAPTGVEVLQWADVPASDVCTMWFVARGPVIDLEQQVHAVLPDAQLTSAQYSVDGVVEARRCD